MNTSESITTLLNALFPEQNYEEKERRQIKALLGELTHAMSSEEVHVLINEVKFLVENWVDEFEASMLQGKTLNMLLNEG